MSEGPGAFGVAQVSLPTLVLCSDARRTRSTAELVLASAGQPARVQADPRLYGATPAGVLEVIEAAPNEVDSLMVVGHNPTVFDLGFFLLPDGDDAARQRLEAHGMPTCTLSIYSFDVASWGAPLMGAATLVGLFSPPF